VVNTHVNKQVVKGLGKTKLRGAAATAKAKAKIVTLEQLDTLDFTFGYCFPENATGTSGTSGSAATTGEESNGKSTDASTEAAEKSTEEQRGTDAENAESQLSLVELVVERVLSSVAGVPPKKLSGPKKTVFEQKKFQQLHLEQQLEQQQLEHDFLCPRLHRRHDQREDPRGGRQTEDAGHEEEIHPHGQCRRGKRDKPGQTGRDEREAHGFGQEHDGD
jgi:hypothetical protein